MKYLGIILMVLIIFSGCASIEENLRQKYAGVHKNRLLGQWGVPDQKIPDEQGGEIWIYSYEKINVKPIEERIDVKKDDEAKQKTTTTRVYPPMTTKTTYYKSFYIGPNGIIYDVAYGSRCN